jgi:catechol 2,3-dioxygenase-like lactoylglutathione lyase family enzyme
MFTESAQDLKFTRNRRMKTLIWLLAALCMTRPLWAQLEPPNETGVTMGSIHLIVRDVEANKKFFALFGGTPLKIDGAEVIKLQEVLVFLTKGNPVEAGPPPDGTPMICGCPADNLESSVANHLGFLVRDYDEFFAKFKTAGVKMAGIPGGGRRQIIVFSPDNLAFEMGENKSIDTPFKTLHIHFFAPAYNPQSPHGVPAFEMYSWYAKNFGATLANPLGSDLPGMHSRNSVTPLATQPTKGHVLDHIGFEVKNLEEFCKKLEANKVKFDKPYSKTRHQGYASAELTDPFGVSIELTEGLNRF